jgi:hypothetical protein
VVLFLNPNKVAFGLMLILHLIYVLRFASLYSTHWHPPQEIAVRAIGYLANVLLGLMPMGLYRRIRCMQRFINVNESINLPSFCDNHTRDTPALLL